MFLRETEPATVTNEPNPTEQDDNGLNQSTSGNATNQRHINHPECTRSNLSLSKETNYVELVNGSRLTSYLSESNQTDCFFVLFYVPWCPFSARLAHIFNALPRAFPTLDVLAFDVSKSVGYNTKFGTSAVPILLMFQNKNVLAKFNYTNKNLTDYIDFVANVTGLKPNVSIEIEVNDFDGPVPSVAVKRFDYGLLLSWLFLLFVSIDFTLRKTQFKPNLIRFLKKLFNYDRLLQLPPTPLRPMIQNTRQEQRAAHLHND